MSKLAANARTKLLLLALCQTAFGARPKGRDDDLLSLNSLDHHAVGLIEVGTRGLEMNEEKEWDECSKELDNLQRCLAEFCSQHAAYKGRRKIEAAARCKDQAQTIVRQSASDVYAWQHALLDTTLHGGISRKTPVFWAGFWPGGKKGIDTREALADFVTSIHGFQLADTWWGRMAEARDVHNLEKCTWDRKKNFWITASEDMAKSMRRHRVPRIIIALHKSLGGDYSFYNSILFNAELQSMGLEMRNTPDWNPQFVLHSIPMKGSEQSSGCALASKVKWRLEKNAKRPVTVFCKTCKTLEDCGPPNDLQKFNETDETANCRTGRCKNGKGLAIYKNKDKYTGGFKDGLQDGKGTYIWANGDKYEGEFKNGFEDGKGTFTWADGDKYEGEWKDGLRHGIGTLTLANNIKYEGVWEKGRKSKGTLNMKHIKDLAKAHGVNSQRHGKGGNSRH